MNSPLPDSLRLFVAIRLPDEVREQVRKAQRELQRDLRASQVRWTMAEQWHLTLKFLGDVPASHLEPLVRALQDQTRGFGPLTLQAGQLGAFPGPQSPRVLWIGVADADGRLPQLHLAVEAAVRSLSAEPAEADFRGHITLGRVKRWSRTDDAALRAATTAAGSQRCGKWIAEAAELIRSELQSAGAKYTGLATIPLGTGSAVDSVERS